MSAPGMVIVGAGKAGARAVIALRENGWTGSITLIGDETLPAYDRPPLSKAAITVEGEPSPVLLLDDGMMASLKAEWIGGDGAVFIDRAKKMVTLASGRQVPYHKLLLATGAGPRPLPAAGAERCCTLRNFADSLALRQAFQPGRNVAVIGGGFIGLELAASARKRGASVTVIEAQPRILMRGVTADVAGVVAARHAQEGVIVLTGCAIDGIEKGAIVLADGRRIPADIVVAGIGAVPETKLAAEAGLAIDNGIACDAELRTSDPDIYAAGDCCSVQHDLYDGRRLRFEAWRAAQDQADVAARNMLGGHQRYATPPWFWSDQYDYTLQIAGLPEDGAYTVKRQIKDNAFVQFHLAKDGVLVGASGIGPGNAIARDIRMAELLMMKRAKPDAASLADPGFALKSLLKA
jgi:3-phenylpropionate/trans-cinnamate dioxygenase ferredoxin reductase subunit